jgi:23S rRNA (pseudouridine1915-N3)-methyltransferase
MRIRVIAVGQRLQPWVKAGCEEYVKRLPRDWNFELVAVKAAARSEGKPAAAAMQAEARAIAGAIGGAARRVMLDERGRQVTTAQLAGQLTRWQRDGREVALIIGGADGLDPDFRQSADETLALSHLTLPHGLVRLLLVEQLYRASSVLQGHPYHRV